MAAQLDKTTANILTSESSESSPSPPRTGAESRVSAEEFVKDESENSVEGEGSEKDWAERARARARESMGEERKS